MASKYLYHNDRVHYEEFLGVVFDMSPYLDKIRKMMKFKENVVIFSKLRNIEYIFCNSRGMQNVI